MMTAEEYNEILAEFKRRKNKRIVEDGESVSPFLAINDSVPGVFYQDAALTDSEKMDLAYQKSVDALNSWRDEPPSSANTPLIDDSHLSQKQRMELAYERSVRRLNDWRDK